MIRRLLELLFGEHAVAEIVDREMAMEELRREREQAWAEDSLPTFENAHGCVNCGVIQVPPKQRRCALCGSSEVVSLAKQLGRGHVRVAKRRDVLPFRKAN